MGLAEECPAREEAVPIRSRRLGVVSALLIAGMFLAATPVAWIATSATAQEVSVLRVGFLSNIESMNP
ncbi:MAG: hypothetical protein ACREDF_10750, partial [Thermoplasmata archaeon]